MKAVWSCCIGFLLAGAGVSGLSAQDTFSIWLHTVMGLQKQVDDKSGDIPAQVSMELVSQGWGQVQINRSVLKTALTIGRKTYERGMGSHADAHFRVILREPARRFYAEVGVDNSADTAGKGTVNFKVQAGARVLAQTGTLHGGDEPTILEADLTGLESFDIRIGSASDGISYDQADLGQAYIELADGRKVFLDEVCKGGENQWLLDDTRLPFAFEYGEKPSDELLPGWKRIIRQEKDDAQGETTFITWEDPNSGLVVEWKVIYLPSYRAAEMRLSFEHHGKNPSSVMRQVQVIRQHIPSLPVEMITAMGGVAGWQGDPQQSMPIDFQPSTTRLAKSGDSLQIGAAGGWSSNKNLPFWLILHPNGEGLYYGLGWTGQWQGRIDADKEQGCTLVAGMEHLNVRLQPGERISQPSVLLGHFSHGRWAGHNALRRVLYEHYSPLLAGRKPEPPVSWNHWFTFGNAINEKNILELIESSKDLGIEYFCVDAGWYNVDFWEAGDWRPNPQNFLRGLEPIAQAIKKNGMAMGLWFDPERVTEKAYEAFAHKEWLAPASKQPAKEGGRDVRVWLVDLSIPAAQAWVVALISDYYQKLDLRWIRYDMNYPPLEMWLLAHENEPERLGMKEIRYVEGLYSILDRLREKCPDLCIEWCAGGGRRIDLQTIRRSHTFWKSDVTGNGDVTRCHLTGGNLFLPGNYLNSNLIRLNGVYDYFCQFGGALGFGHNFCPDDQKKRTEAAQMIAQYKQIRHFLLKDYYPLFTDYPADPRHWDGWQFHDPRKNEGFFLVLRPQESPYAEAMVTLHDLDSSRSYGLITDEPDVLPHTVTGQTLVSGLAVRIASPRQAVLVRYHVLTP